MTETATVYDRVGGAQFFVDLVDRFYDRVADDEVLRRMYPDDLTDSRRHLAGFLMQYWGGPADYSETRGHPRLRMRHMPFRIGPEERDAWVHHMGSALDADRPADDIYEAMVDYFTRSADFLRNTDPLSLRSTEGDPQRGPGDAEGGRPEQ